MCLALGMLGVPLPVLPTTPFLLLSAACFLRGSPRMHAWMVTNRFFGRFLADYRAGQGVPLATKVAAIALLWAGIGASAFLFVASPTARAVLLAIAVAVTVHIALIKVKKKGRVPVPIAPAAVRLVDVGAGDLAMIAGWLREEHVRRWWGDPAAGLRAIAAPRDGARRALIEAAGLKVGVVLWGHPPAEELAAAGLADVPAAAIDIDIMIGERDALGRGIAAAALRQVADAALADAAVPYLIAAVMAGNAASLRAFVKAGFRVEREFADPESGPCLLLRQERQAR